MKVWIAAAPLLALGLWAAVALLRGRLSRRSANVAVALVLLLYVVVTAALGVFWVARMDLPVFDWHYLFGYGLLLVLALHLALQVPSLAAFFRRASPAWLLSPDGRRFARPMRALGSIAFGLVLLAPALAWLVGRALPAQRIRIEGGTNPGSASATALASRSVWIERDGKRVSVPEYVWAESRHTRSGVLRAPGVAPPRPPAVRQMDGARSVTLPRPRALGHPTRADAGARIVAERLDLPKLSELLHHTYGVTARAGDELPFRAAASAGALYPTDVFVVAPSDAVIAAGVHYYDPEAHALRFVGGIELVTRALGALPGDSAARSAPLVVVLGATFDRSAFKYDTRAYRYVGLDAGHVAWNLVEAADVLGLPCTLEPWFDDDALSSALGLDADGEGAILAAACGGQAPSGARQRPAHGPVSLPDSADLMELTRLSHRLTSWRLGEGAPAEGDAGAAFGWQPRARSADPLALMRERRSFRNLSSQAVSRAELDAVLDAARGAIGALGLPALVEVLVAVRAVTGLAPGTYRLGEALAVALASPDVAPRLQAAGLGQEVLGRAAFVVTFALRPETAEPRDFRHALLQAGLAGEAVYLEAGARGLGACGVGAFFDDELAQLFGSGTRPLHLVAVGKK